MPVAQARPWPARWLGWFLLILFANACGVFWANPAPTRVAQGRYYASGDAEFDEFFLALHRLQVELEAAPEREREALVALANALEVPEPEHRALEEKLHARMNELHEAGTRTHLVRKHRDQPERVALAVEVQGRVPEGKERDLLSAIETSGSTLLELTTQAARAKDKLETLSLTAIRLEPNIGDHFRKEGPAKTDEVSKNLRDARKAIASMTASLDGINDRSTKLLIELEEAVGGSAASAAPTPPPAVATDEAPPSSKPTPPAKRPSSTRRSAPQKPAPPPAAKPAKPDAPPASDFEP